MRSLAIIGAAKAVTASGDGDQQCECWGTLDKVDRVGFGSKTGANGRMALPGGGRASGG